MDCSLPGFSVHGIFQARVLEWVVISFSRGSSQPRPGCDGSLGGAGAQHAGTGLMGGRGSSVLEEAGGCDLRGQQSPRKGEQAGKAQLGFLEGVSRDPSAG